MNGNNKSFKLHIYRFLLSQRLKKIKLRHYSYCKVKRNFVFIGKSHSCEVKTQFKHLTNQRVSGR